MVYWRDATPPLEHRDYVQLPAHLESAKTLNHRGPTLTHRHPGAEMRITDSRRQRKFKIVDCA